MALCGLALLSGNNCYYNKNAYGVAIGTTVTAGNPGGADRSVYGVTTDPDKSGIVAVLPSTTIGTVTSKELGSFYIKY